MVYVICMGKGDFMKPEKNMAGIVLALAISGIFIFVTAPFGLALSIYCRKFFPETEPGHGAIKAGFIISAFMTSILVLSIIMAILCGAFGISEDIAIVPAVVAWIISGFVFVFMYIKRS